MIEKDFNSKLPHKSALTNFSTLAKTNQNLELLSDIFNDVNEYVTSLYELK